MTTLAFISRHAPTAEQVALAEEQGFTLHHVGDADAFTVGVGFVHQKAGDMDVTFVRAACQKARAEDYDDSRLMAWEEKNRRLLAA